VKIKSKQLGMNASTAAHQLRKSIIMDLARKCQLDICFRCGNKIEESKEFSIDHKVDWMYSENPKILFFDMANIAFSHKQCNYGNRRCPQVTDNKCGYKGVSFSKKHKNKPYAARISNGKGRSLYLGAFATAKEAAEIYDSKAIELFGEKAITNKMMDLLE
jgi:hypothetical protein